MAWVMAASIPANRAGSSRAGGPAEFWPGSAQPVASAALQMTEAMLLRMTGSFNKRQS
jgi:hypothetical protein